jgi:5-(carboxyamino)imidazole ribonucleotide synthase
MPFYPGSKIGVIGGGQLGRLFIFECKRMGYDAIVLDPDLDGPAAQVADKAFHPANVANFVRECDIATYEFEHVDIDVVRETEKSIPVFPSSQVLRIKQNRASEKTYLSERGFPVPRFTIFKDGSEIPSLIKSKNLVVKTSTGGYDGKGLYTIKSLSDYEGIKEELKQEIVAEEYVPFTKEVSVICGRSKKGDVVLYPVVENIHDKGILLYTVAPADISKKAKRRAYEIVSDLAKALDLVGIMCVEMFLLENDELLINEFAPRPHNSGHYSMDACDISQFEMLLRAICGLPMTEPELLCPSAMLNILGKDANELELEKILSMAGVKIHLYGKKEARNRRKMGHINVLGKSAEDVKVKLNCIRSVLYPESSN